uniref:Cytochrome c oxidase subunit 3 n=1 Tax=Wallacidia oculata TaxID=590134 RepID=E0WBN8_9HYME|nr:cytochrome c oxidase subunit III [Wallacidia oculata]
MNKKPELPNIPFHMVTESPWPLLMSLTTMNTLINVVMMFYAQKNLFLISMLTMITCLIMWFRDIVRESLFQGTHTKTVQNGLKLGMIMFIASEVFLFLSLFWMLMNSSYLPSAEVGMNWPPRLISPFNPIGVPLLNTVILLTSGFFITWSHHALMSKNLWASSSSLALTILCGNMFMTIQAIEYLSAPFSMSDSSYGSAFFLITGFHGMHVMIGGVFLSVTLKRMAKSHFSSKHHFNFEAAAWYWHFVDVVWIMVFILLYF